VAVFSTTLFSCGGKKAKGPETVSVKPKTTAVKGELGDCFTVVDATYTIKEEDYNGNMIIVELKRTDAPLPLDPERTTHYGVSGDVDYNAGFGLDLFSDQGPELITSPSDEYALGDRTQLKTILKLKSGETGFLKIKVGNFTGKNLTSFQVTSAIEKMNDGASSGSEGDNSSSSGAGMGGNANSDEANAGASAVDCDQFYADYEAFVDSYIKLLKKYKANPSDATIVAEYSEAASRAASLETDASGCADSKYAGKIIALQQKLAKAATGL
jgi:hypothetical protein